MKNNVYFVSGIDTNVGKSYATGFIARTWNSEGRRTITQKLIQTGNTGMSEDIELHRRIMGCGLLPEDREGLTMPEIFSYPCSPHLAAEIDGRQIDFWKIQKATEELAGRYNAVLLEGAGGLMVPLTRKLLTIDYILGLEAIRARRIRLHTVAYNLFPREEDDRISRDTEGYIRDVLAREWPDTQFVTVPVME